MVKASADGSHTQERLDPIEIVQQLDPGLQRTQLEKVLYPEDGLRTAELIAYYTAVADWMLPHVAKRPLVLLRCPEGRRKNCFAQMKLDSSAPAAIARATIREPHGEMVCGFVEDLAGLVALAQLGALEIHSWGCHVPETEKPDLLVFGLDPDPALAAEAVVEAAFALREQLAVLGLESFVQSSGAGLQVRAPVQAKHDWEEHKAFAHGVVSAMAKSEPERYVTNPRKSARRGRIYLDYLRNARGSSTLAPYSPRATKDAPIGVPLGWRELEQGAPRERFDLRDVIRRLEQNPSDPWRGFGQLAQALPSNSLRKRLAVA